MEKLKPDTTGVFKMTHYQTDIPGLIIIEPKLIEDSRGYFFESFNEQAFRKIGISAKFVQDNQSKSSFGVIRGLHYQINPYAQAKLVRVLDGSILDVAVDIRKGSPTYGKSFKLELSADNKKQLFIPAGFAHGFSVLTKTAVVLYKCDHLYNKENEGGILYNDPALNIDWQIPKGEEIVSEKDSKLPRIAECRNNFEYNGSSF